MVFSGKKWHIFSVYENYFASDNEIYASDNVNAFWVEEGI